MQEIEKAPSFPQDEAVNTIDNVSKIHRNPLLNKDAAVKFGLVSPDNEDDEKSWLNYVIPQGVNIPEPDAIFKLQDEPLLTRKSLSLLIAKAKQGKSTVASWIVSQIIQSNVRVLWGDTEQGLFYGSRTQFWILRQAGIETCPNLTYLDLKAVNTVNRIDIIEDILSTQGFDFVVIDGSRDLVFDINDPHESTEICTKLMQWADNYNCHILNILHENKGSDTARGHIGTELQNKSEVVIRVSTNDMEEVCIEPVYCRAKPFKPFALNRDEYGIPYLIEGWAPSSNESKKKPMITDKEAHRLFMEILSDDKSFNWGELRTLFKLLHTERHYSIGDNKAKDFLTIAKNNNWIVQKDGNRGPYKLALGL